MIAAIWIVSVALDFLRRNDDPFPIFAPPSQQIRPNVFDFGRIAVLLVAATLVRVIWHVPGAVELFVKLHVLLGMVVILSLGRERQTKKRHAHFSESMQTSKRELLAPFLDFGDRDLAVHAVGVELDLVADNHLLEHGRMPVLSG